MRLALMRKFTLFDAMILVAATAAGLALFRMFLAEGRFFQGAPFQGPLASYVLSGIEAVYPFLFTWTFALVILRIPSSLSKASRPASFRFSLAHRRSQPVWGRAGTSSGQCICT